MQLDFLGDKLEDTRKDSKKPSISSPDKLLKKGQSSVSGDLFGDFEVESFKPNNDGSVSSGDKSEEAFKTISEVAEILSVQQHVLRFWESRFAQIKPLKMAGGRRYYRPEDIDILGKVKDLLYAQGYTIKGAKRALSSLKHRKNDKSEQVDESEHDSDVIEYREISVLDRELTEKQKKQATSILKELVALRKELYPYVCDMVSV
ncbi:MAG: MerR family transcriptional regulator [Rickettsiales bacterium]